LLQVSFKVNPQLNKNFFFFPKSGRWVNIQRLPSPSVALYKNHFNEVLSSFLLMVGVVAEFSRICA